MSLLTLDQCKRLLADGILVASDFERFLREQELRHLKTYEPDFVKEVTEGSLSFEVRKVTDKKGNDAYEPVFKFRRGPSLWLSLLHETSEVSVGLKHLMTACTLTECWGED